MWVEFVVGSCPCFEGFFLRVLRFSSLHKNQPFQIPVRSGNSGSKSHLMDFTEILLFIHLLELWPNLHVTSLIISK